MSVVSWTVFSITDTDLEGEGSPRSGEDCEEREERAAESCTLESDVSLHDSDSGDSTRAT